MFQRDGTRPHVSLAARTGLRGLDWGLLPHPPYSPGIAPPGSRLFLSLREGGFFIQNHMGFVLMVFSSCLMNGRRLLVVLDVILLNGVY